MSRQQFHGVLCQLAAVCLLPFRDAIEEMLRQQRDVATTFPQSRQLDGEHLQPVIEILTEPTLLDHGAKVAVGGRHQPDVGVQGSRATDPLESALFQDAQDFGLDRQGQLSNLVEKQGAAVRHLEASSLSAVSTGEGAFFVSEELALDQRLGNRRAVDRHEGSPTAGRKSMQGASEELLAGTALAGQEHRAVGTRHPLQELQGRTDPLMLPDDGRSTLHLEGDLVRGFALQGSHQPE